MKIKTNVRFASSIHFLMIETFPSKSLLQTHLMHTSKLKKGKKFSDFFQPTIVGAREGK